MTGETSKAPVVPDPALPKTIGILNLVFGGVLLLCGTCSGLYTVAMYAAQGQLAMLQGTQSGLNVKVKVDALAKPAKESAKNDQNVAKTPADIDEKAVQAPDEDSKKKAGEPPAEKDAAPVPSPPKARVSMVAAMNDPASGFAGMGIVLNRYLLVDLATGMVLNILMIISGVGLVLLRDWGRKLALMVAGFKIARLVILAAVFLAFVIPGLTEDMNKVFEKMAEIQRQQTQQMAQQAPAGAAPAPGPPQIFADPNMRMMMTRSYVMMFAGTSVVVTLLGLIYPCITLVALTRPKARAACEQKRMER